MRGVHKHSENFDEVAAFGRRRVREEFLGAWWSDAKNKVMPLKSSQRPERRPHYSILYMISIFAWSLTLPHHGQTSKTFSEAGYFLRSDIQLFTKVSRALSEPHHVNDDRTRSSPAPMSCLS